jgi:hypothetical protein
MHSGNFKQITYAGQKKHGVEKINQTVEILYKYVNMMLRD